MDNPIPITAGRQAPFMSLNQIIRIAQSLAGHVDLQEAVAAMSRELQAVLPHDHIDAALLSEDGRDLIVYETGIVTSWGQKRCAVDVSPIRDILQGDCPGLVFRDALHDERLLFPGIDNEPIRTFGFRARLHTKIEIAGDLIGVLSLSSLQCGIYDQHHMDVLNVVANVVGPYFHALRAADIAQQRTVEYARELVLRQGAEYLTEVQDMERSRIGMDLHDQVLADLSRLKLKLADTSIPEEQRLEDATDSLQRAVEDVRHIVEDARPSLLELFGLGTAIEAFLASATDSSGLTPVVDFDPADLDAWFADAPKMRISLYRIVQEAVNNAVRHSKGQHVRITAEERSDSFRIAIDDDGSGFDHHAPVNQGGIQNIHARSALIGARLQFGPGTDQSGTQVAITLAKESVTP